MTDSLSKRFKNNVMSLEEVPEIKFWETGILGLDYLMGGGYPQRRTVEVWGGESVGKTTLVLESCKPFLDKGYKVFFVDGELTVSKSDIKRLGLTVNTDNFHIGYPNHGEEGVDMIIQAIKEGYALIILDSVPSLIPKAKQEKIEKDSSASSIASEASMWKNNIPTIGQYLKDSEVIKSDGTIESYNGSTLVMINQQRANVASPFGGKTTMGGHALLHHFSVRIRLQSIRKAADEETGGRRIAYSLDKSKVGPPNRNCEMSVLPNGIDRIDNLINFAIWTEDLIRKGAWYNLSPDCAKALGQKEKIGQGVKAIYEAFNTDPDFYQNLYQLVYNKTFLKKEE